MSEETATIGNSQRHRDSESGPEAVVFDASRHSRLIMTGPDRHSFLHNFCTNEIKGLPIGSGCEAFLLNVKGRILGHLLVFATEDALHLDGLPGQTAFLLSHLNRYHLLEDFQLRDRNDESGELLLTGPRALRVLTEAIGLAAELPDRACRTIPVSIGSESIPLLAKRFDFLAEPTILLTVPPVAFETLRARLIDCGASSGSAEQFEALRVRAGFPHYGVDLSDQNLAQEAARTDSAISFTKGCYLGQEPVARIRAMGHVNRELRRFQIHSANPVEPGTELRNPAAPDQPVGTLSSVAGDDVSSQWIGLGMVRSQFAAPGTEIPMATNPPALAIVTTG